MFKPRTFFLAALGVSVLLLSPSHAQPQVDAQAIEDAKKHYANGQKLFESNDLKGAVDEFKEAYRLSKNPVLLYNIGFVYDKLEDASLALHYYEKFLSDAPETAKSHEHRVEVADRVEALKKGEKAASQPAAEVTPEPPQPKEAPPPKGKKGAPATAPAGGVITHETVDEAPPERPVDVTAQVPDAGKVTVTLFYRGAGEDLFQAVQMKPRMNELVGRIPAGAMRGTSVHYYLEVKDKSGKVVGSSGKAGTPNIIYLDPTAKPHYYLDASGDTMVTEAPPLPPVKSDSSGGGAGRSDKKMAWGKWAATGGALVFLGAGVAFYISASSYASTIEGEAKASGTECPTPPCRTYTSSRKDLESSGKNFATLSKVSLVLGTASLVTAGVLWYFDLKHENEGPAKPSGPINTPRAPAEPKVTAVPVIGDGFIGGAAVVTF